MEYEKVNSICCTPSQGKSVCPPSFISRSSLAKYVITPTVLVTRASLLAGKCQGIEKIGDSTADIEKSQSLSFYSQTI